MVRPLNMPGAAPTVVDYRGERYWRRVDDHSTIVTPIVLEPTQAQLDRGERVLWIEYTSQATAMRMLRWGRENGWDARLSRSRYLTAPSNAGAAERRGRRLEVETVCLRLHHAEREITAALTWEFDVERARWKPAMALWSFSGGMIRLIGITAMQLIMGMPVKGKGSEEES
jgi:hypothetical protein